MHFFRSLTSVTLTMALLVGTAACSGQDTPTNAIEKSTSINKILPLGASRVQGDRPEYESFRYELWKDLVEQDWEFDFIGTMQDQASYEDFMGLDFDPDHEGRGGWTSGAILYRLRGWLEQTGAPDIVLFSSPGGNDALQGLEYAAAVENVREIVEVLQAENPEVTILIEQMAPGHSDIMNDALSQYFVAMQNEVSEMAESMSTESSRVIAVDMHTGFSDQLLADDVHYNVAGAEFIASRYYKVLAGVLEK